MKKRITINKNPYYDPVDLFKKKAITIKPGVTVLVGCNGSGKTSLLKQIEDSIRKGEEIVFSFNNLKEGGQNSLEKQFAKGNFTFVSQFIQRSEGENIMLNISDIAMKIGELVKRGRFETKKELWIILDAVDSGLSIDNIVDVKDQLFDTILNDERIKDVSKYIIISTNTYEVARGERCYDVSKCEYVNNKSYEEYRDIILKTKETKTLRYDLIFEINEKENNDRSLDFDRDKIRKDDDDEE